MTSTPTIKPDADAGMLDPRGVLWLPPSIDYTWRDRVGTTHTVQNITRLDFTAHHVVFWRGDELVLAEHADRVGELRQVPAEDPA